MPPTLSYTRVSTKAATDTVVTARKIGIVGNTTIAVTDTWIGGTSQALPGFLATQNPVGAQERPPITPHVGSRMRTTNVSWKPVQRLVVTAVTKTTCRRPLAPERARTAYPSTH